MRILVVEDEAGIRESLREDLARVGFNVDLAADGEEGLFAGTQYPVDVAIIDLGLPKMSGLELIRRLREKGKTFPILVLTARDRWQDKVEGLEAGADDYVAKPFHFEEVHARLLALLRRSGGWATAELVCGPIALDTRRQSVRVNDKAVDLTTYEYRLLEHFMLRAGQILTRSELSERMYEEEVERESNNIDVFMTRLRRKLDPKDELKPFETIRGRGWRFAIPRTTAPKE